MQHRFQRTSLAPSGFAVDGVTVVAERVQARLRSRYPVAACPDCGDRADEFKADICTGPQICLLEHFQQKWKPVLRPELRETKEIEH